MSPVSLPNSRAPSPTASEQPAKRKKLSTACDACQKRKSRCEMITPKGCHRCRTLGTECSRAGYIPGWGAGDDGAGPSVGRDGEYAHDATLDDSASMGMLADIQARTKRMEGMLGSMMRRSGSGDRPMSHPVSAAGEVEASGAEPSRLESAAGITNRALELRCSRRITDPVAAGLVTLHQWTTLYDKSNIDKIIPLRSLLSSASVTDPLFRTCILVYQAATLQFRHSSQSVHLHNHLRTSLDRLSTVPATREAVLGLLILSFAPPSSEEGAGYTAPDKFGAAARAVDMGYALGLDRAAERVMREDPEDMGKEWMSETLDDMKLWYAICHRARWVDIYNSPNLLVRPALVPPVNIRHAQDLDDPFLAHLLYESQLLETIHNVLEAMRVLRTARVYDVRHTDGVIQAVTSYLAVTAIWRDNALAASPHCPSTIYLILSNHLFGILLHLHISDFTACPTPLGLETVTRLTRDYSNGILSSSVASLRFLIDHPDLHLAHLPSFTYTLILLAYKAVSQSRKLHDSNPGPIIGDSPGISQDVLIQVRTRLIHAHPQYTPLLAKIDGADAPKLWGEAIRDLQQSRGEDLAGWGNGDAMVFDFDAFFGPEAGFGMEWMGGADGAWGGAWGAGDGGMGGYGGGGQGWNGGW